MNKFFAAFVKEILLLIRDKAGIASLFVMPIILVFVMTVIEDSALNSLVDQQISILYCNPNNDSLGNSVKEGLLQSHAFTLIEKIDGKPLEKQQMKTMVANGKYPVGVYIPEGATDSLRSNARQIVLKTFAEIGLGAENFKPKKTDSIVVDIFYDPAVKNSLKAVVEGAVGQNSSLMVGKMISGLYSEILSEFLPGGKKLNVDYPQMITINKQYSSNPDNTIKPNSTQHNVPSWTLFAMFFILIPLAGSIIQEKDGGTYMRLVTMPKTNVSTFAGKVVVYMLVCLLQVTILFSMGVYIIPKVGLPALQLGSHFNALAVIVLVTAFAAVGFGTLIGAFMKTFQQAASVGVILIIILASLGGLWMPVYYMPKAMQSLTMYSPLSWSLRSFYDLFLRDADLNMIMPNVVKIFFFGLSNFVVAIVYNTLKRAR